MIHICFTAICYRTRITYYSHVIFNRLKLFKTDLLQCTADELNYSLCLFVKEVRKPNGDEYAPDSIYYLCLGMFLVILIIFISICSQFVYFCNRLKNYYFFTFVYILVSSFSGIQQYLFENSRIDNIFTDIYFEKFTECLNEVLQNYEVRLNTAGKRLFRKSRRVRRYRSDR